MIIKTLPTRNVNKIGKYYICECDYCGRQYEKDCGSVGKCKHHFCSRKHWVKWKNENAKYPPRLTLTKVIIEKDGGGYIAYFPRKYKGCIAGGNTIPEVKKNFENAFISYLMSMFKHGEYFRYEIK